MDRQIQSAFGRDVLLHILNDPNAVFRPKQVRFAEKNVDRDRRFLQGQDCLKVVCGQCRASVNEDHPEVAFRQVSECFRGAARGKRSQSWRIDEGHTASQPRRGKRNHEPDHVLRVAGILLLCREFRQMGNLEFLPRGFRKPNR